LFAELVDLGFFVVTATILTRRFGIEGLAAARSMTFFVVMAILIFVLGRRGLLKLSGLSQFLLRTIAATAAMGLTSWLIWHFLQPLFESAGTLLRLAVIILAIGLSAGVFLGLAVLLRLGEARQIITTVLDLVPGRGRRGEE